MSDPTIFEYLSGYGKESFKQLCDLGCHPRILDILLSGLNASQGRARNTIRVREAQQIAGRASKVLEDVNYLDEVGLLNALLPSSKSYMPQEYHQPGARLKAYFKTRLLLFDFVTNFLESLTMLPRLVKNADSEKLYIEQRSDIHKYLRSSTGSWRDRLLADILNDLFPDPNEPPNEDSLKSWRHRHNLKG